MALMTGGNSGTSGAKLALQQLVESLPSAAGASDPKERVDAVGKVQDAGAPHFATLLTGYLDEIASSFDTRDEIWKALSAYQGHLTQTLCAAAGAALSAGSAVRALAAIRGLAKLHLVHYSRMHRNIWRVAYKIHSSSEKHGFATRSVHAPAGHAGMTTVQQELLRLLMLQVSAPDMMTPQQIEAADRAVERLGAEFTLRQPGVADNPFCYDPEGEFPPRRAKGRDALPAHTRYFGPGMGYDSLEHMVKLASARPEDFTLFGKDLSPLEQYNAVKHLLIFWNVDCSYAPPAHTPAEGSLLVSHGFGPVWQHLSTSGEGTHELSLVEDSAMVAQPPEVWELRGEGGNEITMQVAPASRNWAKCGKLVGVTMGDAQHAVGVIRRMHAGSQHGLEADIAILSCEPRACTLREVLETGEDSGFSDAASRVFGLSAVNAVIVADGTDPAMPPNMLVPLDHWKEGRMFELQEGSETRFLRVTQALRRGDDFVRTTFEWLTLPRQ